MALKIKTNQTAANVDETDVAQNSVPAEDVPATENSVPADENGVPATVDDHGIRHNKEEDASASVDPLKRGKGINWRNFGGEGLIFSLIFHAVLGIIAIFIVVHHYVQKPEEDPDAFVSGSGGGSAGDRAERRMKPKNRPDMKQSKARIASKSATASIALPDMPQMSMGSSFSGGMSAGDSSGLGGGVGGGIGPGKGVGVGGGKNFVSAFGSTLKRDTDLEGYIYDLKTTAQGSTICTAAGDNGNKAKRRTQLQKAMAILHNSGKAGGGSWNVKELDKHWRKGPTALYNTQIFFVADNGEPLLATKATQAFADPETKKEPFPAPGWLCVYSGKFSVPESGYYRFVGMGDETLIVGAGASRARMQTVLYAFWPGEGNGNVIPLPKGNSQVKATDDKDLAKVKIEDQWEPKKFCGPGGTDGNNIAPPNLIKNAAYRAQKMFRYSTYKGHWLRLEKGKKYYITVAFGEAGGGHAGALMGIQKKGRDNDDNFPLFTLTEHEPEDPVIKGWRLSKTGRYNVSECHIASGF